MPMFGFWYVINYAFEKGGGSLTEDFVLQVFGNIISPKWRTPSAVGLWELKYNIGTGVDITNSISAVFSIILLNSFVQRLINTFS